MGLEISENSLVHLQVLLVEDNPLNLQLLQNLLISWGAQVKVAIHGKEAIELLENNRFDLVLMDIQMPEMDGYKTTQHIRSTSDKSIQQIKIIAVTAHASEANRKKCLDIGMDDFIAKPIDPSKLYAKIVKLCRIGNMENEASKKQEALNNSEKSTHVYVNLKYLEDIAMGDLAFVHEMMHIFQTQTPILLKKMWQGIDEQNWVAFRKVVHQIKPNISYMGITQNEGLIQEIQDIARAEEELDRLPKLVKEFEKNCLAAIKELESISSK